ncbi:MAG TPA: IPT/TIG domain-containing protein, partial [Planctomycetota bacterium]|nr:IPT/TIG domain-containing protein [Planctomycetota bacterium]
MLDRTSIPTNSMKTMPKRRLMRSATLLCMVLAIAGVLAPPAWAQQIVTGFGGSGTGWSVNGGASIANDVATLTDNNGNEARTVFYNTLVTYNTGFTVKFDFMPSNLGNPADGCTLCLQNQGSGAVGGGGGSLAYNGITGNSVALELNVYGPNTVGYAFRQNGATGAPYTPPSPVNLVSGNTITITVVYNSNASTLAVNMVEANTNNVFNTTLTGVNLTTLMGGNGTTAFIGFTGATGGAQCTQKIANFSFVQTNPTVINGPPQITSITPITGSNVGGSGMTINGANFDLDATVQFIMPSGGGATANALHVVWVSSQLLMCQWPAANPITYTGTADMTVNNVALGTSGSATAIFTYTASSPPTVTSVSPLSGPTAGGTLVTVTGTNFSPTSTVTIGGVAATNVTINSNTQLTLRTPVGTTGQADVVVTNPDTTSNTLTGGYTYINPVIISPFNLNTVGTGTGVATTTLTYFNNSQVVTITPTPANATGVSIYYTTDGTTPVFPIAGTTQLYTAPFTINANSTISAIEVVNSNGTNGPVLSTVFKAYFPGAAVPVQLTTGSMNYVFNATNALPPFNTGSAVTASGIVTAVAPDVLTDGAQDRTAPFAAGTTQPLAGLIGEGTLLNGRTLAAGNSNGSNGLPANPIQGRFTGYITIPTSGVYSFATGTDDGSLLWIDPTSLTAPDAAHLVVANNVGQGVTRRFGQVGLQAGQHTILIDYANTGGGFALGVFWDPTGGTTVANFGTIPNASLGVESQLVASIAPTVATFGGTSNPITLSQKITISNATPTGSFIFYTTDGSTPAFDPVAFTPTGTTVKYTSTFNLNAPPTIGNTVTVKAIAAGPGYFQSAVATQTYTYSKPTVTSCSPAVGSPTSNGALTITVNGTNFSQPNVTSVLFGTHAATNISNTTINANGTASFTCTLPNSATNGAVVVTVTNNDTQTGALTAGFTYTGAPTITSLSVGNPENVPANSGTSIGGEPFSLQGNNFAPGCTVLFGTNPATGVTVLHLGGNSYLASGTTPASTIPAASGGPAGNLSITYIGSDGRSVTQAYDPANQPSGFIYFTAPAPAVSTVAPSVGSLSGGTAITISGSNFSTLGATVKIDGIACTGVAVTSASTITATTPPGISTGSKNVVVTNTDGQIGTLAGGFTYLAGDTVSINFNGSANNGGVTTPLNAGDLVGAPSVARTHWNNANGTNGGSNGPATNLTDSAGVASPVTVNWATNENWNSTTNTNDANPNVRMMRSYIENTNANTWSIMVSNVPSSYGLYDVYLYNDTDNQDANRNGNFVLSTAAPPVTNTFRNIGSVFTGANITFTEASPDGVTAGNYTVFRGVTSATNGNVTSGFQVDVTATGTEFRLGVTGIQIVSHGIQVAGVTPAFGPLAGSTTITIKGAGFSNASAAPQVSIAGVAATGVTFLDSNTISAVTPAGAIPGFANVTVINGNATLTQATLANGFAYIGPPPTLDPTTPITPNQGITSGGTAVTITGTNFVAGAAVTIGGFPCTNVVVVSPSQITAVTGASTKSGPSDVVVTNAGDAAHAATAAGAFNYLAPTITSIAPVSGLSSGNYNAVITGTNFGASTKVNFGAAAATNVVINSSTQITCLVPGSANGIIGAVDVVVTDGANSFGTLAGGFTYTTIPADNPAATVAGVEAKFYINGGNKVPGNAPTAVQTSFDSLPIVKGLRVDPGVTANIMTGPIVDPGAPTGPNVGNLLALVQDTLGLTGTNFYMKANGYINITTGGGYTFSQASDDGSLLFIGGNLVIDNNPTGGQAVTPKTGTVNLQPGMHAFTILYGQGVGGYGFSLKYSGPDNGNVLGFVPDSVLFMDAGSPTLTSVNPATGPIGGNTVVTATGTGFLPGATVSVNGVFA